MKLTTAESYFLLTERIGKKPMLRTRFTTQSYFVLAAIFDLLIAGQVKINGGQAEAQADASLPDYLSTLMDTLQDNLHQDPSVSSALKLITSWEIANELYDGIGQSLKTANLVKPVTFQNNLTPHLIFVPTDESRASITNAFVTQLTDSRPAEWALALCGILHAMDALKWVITDNNQRNEILNLVQTDSRYAGFVELIQTAADVITKKRFWLDSWLS